jgi:hypothetical protein
MARLLRLSDVRATAEGEQPAGYRLLGRGQLNLGLLSVLSLVILIPATILFALLTAPLGGPLDPRGGSFSVRAGWLDIVLVALAAGVVLPIVHELVHGLIAALAGARPVYGIGPGVAFCHFQELVGKGTYAAILAAPLVVISVVGCLIMPITPGILRGPLLALLITNASGAVGDLSALWQLRGLPADVLIADTNSGFEIFTREAA